MIEFVVRGTPYPQGSKQAGVSKKGKPFLKEGSGINFAHWRNAVVDVCHTLAETRQEAGDGPLAGALSVEVTFRFRMPASRPKADRVHGIAWRSVGADLDKLLRALGDAMEISGLIVSDTLIAEWHARKIEVVDAWEGCHVTIARLSIPVDAARPTLSLVEV